MLSRKTIFAETLLFLTVGGIAAGLLYSRKELHIALIETDILVYGSSLGGTSAAIIAAEQGANVVFAMDSDVMGGQAVESGLSAFDDQGRQWETWGLYEDLQNYLKKKTGKTSNRSAGLGVSVVGLVSSPVDDIAAFFQERIRTNQRITLFTEHTIANFKKKKGRWYQATLTNKLNNQSTRIRFQYLVDGTETGRLFEQTGTPFAIGIDAAEETGEKLALPKEVRDAVVNGKTQSGKTLAGLGNRVQAVASPFILLDRGYPGDFFPFSLDANPCLGTDTTSNSMIADAKVYRMEQEHCTARIMLAPEFADTYDVYLVSHGSGFVQSSVASPLWAATPLARLLHIQKNKETVHVGAFPLSPEHQTILSVSHTSGQPLVEGVLLVKKNMRASPVVLHKPKALTIPLVHYDIPSAYADIYLTGTNLSSDLTPFIDKKPAALETTQTTLYIPHISLRDRPNLELTPDLRNSLSSIVIIPTEFNVRPLRFFSDAPDKEIPVEQIPAESIIKNTDQPVREWQFTAQDDGLTVFSIDSPTYQWRQLELWQDEPKRLVKSLIFSLQNVSRNPSPLFSTMLTKGSAYRLRIGLSRGEQWNSFTVSADAMNHSASLYTDDPSKEISPRQEQQEGIYDLWAEGVLSSSVSWTLERPGAQNKTLQKTITHSQLEYLGKAFLDRSTTLRINKSGMVLAIPNTDVDTYQWSGTLLGESPKLALASLPPGVFNVTVTGGSAEASQVSVSLEGESTPVQMLSIPAAKTIADHRLAAETFVSNGRPLTLTFAPSFAQSSITLHFYKEIPNLQDALTFTMAAHPLTPLSDRSRTSLFFFRNIVNRESVLAGKPEGFLPSHLARKTLGMSVIIDGPNNYAGFQAEDIDSPAVITASRERSEAFAYWLMYDSALTELNLNCDPADVVCTPKRVRPVIGLFQDRLSLFPPKPYIREGRRMIARRMITLNDIGIPIQNCAPTGCPVHCLPLKANNKECISEEQTPLIFPDALAPVGYMVDVHSLFSSQEFYAIVQPLLRALQVPANFFPLLSDRWRYPFSKPAEVPLSALLPVENTHLLPASHTIGMSQIANGAYRTHVNEMAIGQAVGHLLSYCIEHQLEPSVLTGASLRSLQHTLVERGVLLYPISDSLNPLLSKAVQHLIAEGLLSPQIRGHSGSFNNASYPVADYYVFPAENIDQYDAKIIKLFSQESSGQMTYRDLIVTLHPNEEKHVSASALHALAVHDDIVDEKHLSLTPEMLLDAIPSKGDLYHAAYLLMQSKWAGSSN